MYHKASMLKELRKGISDDFNNFIIIYMNQVLLLVKPVVKTNVTFEPWKYQKMYGQANR